MGVKGVLALLCLLQVLQLQPVLAHSIPEDVESPQYINLDSNDNGGNANEPNSEVSARQMFRRSGASTCTPKYAAEVNHTMCLTDDPRVISFGVSAQDQKAIVDYHNKVRREVNPAATDLREMVYDHKLAAVAEKWAKQCAHAHDKNRKEPDYDFSIGQNAAFGYYNWSGAMTGWFEEVKNYKYGKEPASYLGPKEVIGHYTQMVQNVTFSVGCGFAECRDSEWGKYYVCNYAAGQTTASMKHPYTVGERCSACRPNCQNGLCGCAGKYCENRGYFNVDSCTCTCTSLFKGDFCTEPNCPASEYSGCGSDPFVASNCKVYSNLPEFCPFTCGVCKRK